MESYRRIIALFIAALLVFMIDTGTACTAAAFETENDTEQTAEAVFEGMQKKSMLPLTEVKAYLVLAGYTDEQLHKIPLAIVLRKLEDSDGNRISIPESATTVWHYVQDKSDSIEQYVKYEIDSDALLDLGRAGNESEGETELIIGSGGQLDTDNTRYIIKICYTDNFTYTNDLRFDMYVDYGAGSRCGNGRVKINPCNSGFLAGGNSHTYEYILDSPIVKDLETGDKSYFSLHSNLADDPRISLAVYGLKECVTESSVYKTIDYDNPITDQILNADMSKTGAGYEFTESRNSFVVAYYLNGQKLKQILVEVCLTQGVLSFNAQMFDSGGRDIVYNKTLDSSSGILTLQNELKYGYSASSEQYCSIDVTLGGNTNYDSKVVKAVKGLYSSLEAAAGQKDIKDELLNSGYKDNYGGDGVNFTLFFEDGWLSDLHFYYITVRAADSVQKWREYSDAPVIGEKDPWFGITGVRDADGRNLNIYVVENGKNINLDTMYSYGYQTVLIYDTVDRIVPVIRTPDSGQSVVKSIYVNGKKFIPGDTIDFPQNKNVLEAVFSVIISDDKGKHTKNYHVSFVKKEASGKLYVSGPTGEDFRSVFLDEYFEYKHDILIVNTGGTALTGLRVKLNAENCKLDDYWTVGGKGNDTLAAFSGISSDTAYGELPNLAKIRLLPDGEGDIEGTLTIYADGQKPIVLNLEGQAQNPKIITEKPDDAVRYVPYSYLITTSNMYDWTDVSFSMSGKLPEGLTFIKSTGEIYGVPRETGKFNFTVTASFSGSNYSFESSTVSLTLTVMDNTNSNVFNATDEGYSILNTVGSDAGGYDFKLEKNHGDVLFRSEGVLNQFVDLWLNGKKLVQGVDYKSESGSTKITIYSQTFDSKAEKDGRNTLAAEFRTEDTHQLKRSAQNFSFRQVSTKNRITACTVSLKTGSYVYDGKLKTPGVTVRYKNKTLKSGTDYTVSYSSNRNAGTGKVLIRGKGSYTGSLTKTFRIKKADNTITASGKTKNWKSSSQSFSIGAKAKGNAKLKYASNQKSVTVNSSGKVTIAGKYSGRATITITAVSTANYNAASKKIVITVNPSGTAVSGISNSTAGKMKITWKKNISGNGYQIQYSTSPGFSNSITKTVSGSNIVSASCSVKKGRIYYVRIRTIKKSGNSVCCSSWSNVKSKKITR